jgi:hypothetical protein
MRTTTGRRLDRIEGRLREEEARDTPGGYQRIARRLFEKVVAAGNSEVDAARMLISLGINEWDLPGPTHTVGVTIRIPSPAELEELKTQCGRTAAHIPDHNMVRRQIESYARRTGVAVATE